MDESERPIRVITKETVLKEIEIIGQMLTGERVRAAFRLGALREILRRESVIIEDREALRR